MKRQFLITDFDGTMTERDFFRIALERLPTDAAKPWERYEAGLCSHFDALAQIFIRLRATTAEYDAILDAMRLDDRAAAAMARLDRAGWRVEIASAGCSWYIERLLRRHGIQATVHANPGFISLQGALILLAPVSSPFHAPETGIDKAAVVRRHLARGAVVAYAGDGRPDLPPALLAPPERRFATGWLADELTRRGEPFRRFDCWHDIAVTLTEEASS